MNQPYYPNSGYPQWPAYDPYLRVPKVAGGTAIAAGVLALIEGVPLLLGAAALLIVGLFDDTPDPERPHILLLAGGTAICMAGSVIGAILLLCRRSTGRYLLMFCTFGFLITFAIFVAWATGWDFRTGNADHSERTSSSVVVVAVFVLQLPILALAGAPMTARWIAARADSGYRVS